jgi:hypothetical protein
VSGKIPPQCAQPWVGGVKEIDAPNIPIFTVPKGWYACFGHAAMAHPVGAGEILAVSSPALWTNKYLPDADNAVLATDLVLGRHRADIAWLVQPRHTANVGAGSQSLWSLVPSRVKDALLLMLAAALVVVLCRARRLGRPVAESAVLRVRGSELTLATAYLWQRAGRPARAATALRTEARHQVADRLGQGRSTSPEILATLAAGRTGIDRGRILATLDGSMPTSDQALSNLAEDTTELLWSISGER